MASNIRSVLSPLLLISYVCGSRIIEFPSGNPRPWFSLVYILLLWSVYFSLLYKVKSYIDHYSTVYLICFWLNMFTTLISIVFGMHYDKKFRKCLKKLNIVDNTLKQLGITTDYQKLRKRTVWLILGWFMMVILMTYGEAFWLRYQYGHDVIISIYIPLVLNYCTHINFIGDLIITSILRYVELKFNHVNESLRNITKGNKHGVKHTWQNMLQSHQRQFFKIPSNKFMTWIVIHLHLELRKISREINTTFGMQMTLKMVLYFGFISACFREIFNLFFIHNYVHERMEYFVNVLFWIVLNVFKLLLINYVCEKVSAKANNVGYFIDRISYSICDVEIRENISQLSLQMAQTPLRFYGIGLFQFGFKFLHGFCTSITTVLIILIQAHTNK